MSKSYKPTGAILFIKKLPAAVFRTARPDILRVLESIVDKARDNLERNKSIKTGALSDSLSEKTVIANKKKGKIVSFYMTGYAGTSTESYKVKARSRKKPFTYAKLVEYGNPKYNSSGKPFFRPAIYSVNPEKKINEIFEKKAKELQP